jgi:hypothetical protein
MTTKITEKNISNIANAGVQWQSVFVGDGSTGLTAVAGRGYFINTTSGTVTVTLPASPSAGDTIAIIDYATTFGTNNVTLDRNGNNIKGSAANETISTSDGAYTYVYIDGTQGWKNYTTTDDLPTYIEATGGTISTSGNYKIHTFTGDGCFLVTDTGNATDSDKVDYLIVAGGAGGGSTNRDTGGGPYGAGGGGGAGGFRESKNPADPRTASPIASTSSLTVTATTYPVTVGAGGGTGPDINERGLPGSNSVFSTITSAGGGGGGSRRESPANGPGLSGGSGGGGGTSNAGNDPASGNTPPVSPPQGNNGGFGGYGPPGCFGSFPAYGANGGGGGGATTNGSYATKPSGGSGGTGATTDISGSSTTYAGGGGGGVYYDCTSGCAGSGTGGTGGGGPGGPGAASLSPGNGTSGTVNTGGTGRLGGQGGKGIVIIRYKYQ